LFEFAWVVVPYDETKHGDAYQSALTALDGRKLLHDFAQQEESGEKSTISGERQILGTQEIWTEVAKRQQYHGLRLSKSERLDAVDVIKRLAQDIEQDNERVIPRDQRNSFPSADTVATRSFVAALLKRLHEASASGKPEEQQVAKVLVDAVKKWDDWLNECSQRHNLERSLFYRSDTTSGSAELQKQLAGNSAREAVEQLLDRDGEALFVGSFSRKRLAFRLGKTEQEVSQDSKDAQQCLRAVMAAAGRLGVQAPSPYYAVIKLDGDKMGDTISKLSSGEAHKIFSAALSTFAHGLNTWVGDEEYLGRVRVVYAGGDDALILAPADRALKLAHELQRKYTKAAGDALRSAHKVEKLENEPTASVGIVIAHRLMPLNIVLDEARKAEEAAKHHYHRNALVATVLWRGGRSVSVGAQWDMPPASPIQIEALKDEQPGDPTSAVALADVFQRLFAKDILSDRFAYYLEGEASALAGLSNEANASYEIERAKSGITSEIKRLLKRQSSDSKQGKELPDTDIQSLADAIATLAKAIDDEYHASEDKKRRAPLSLAERGPRRGLVEVCGWLRLASFLARGREAGEDE
ncbi:MAG TPA: type III-B CRISPR-associated protein Cas10/Cmr2, partial [Ktedonobacterales bacterium]|nr:type III-B CRISPR-associated protein Cas10/Cmr2 [Ktedonobacterales bacterium]